MSNDVSIGMRITQLRKRNNWSQTELAKKIRASREIVSRYERDESAPSVEILARLAEVFGVTADFLIGISEFASLDKLTVQRIKDIEGLDRETRTILFNLIDTYIQNYKAKKAFY